LVLGISIGILAVPALNIRWQGDGDEPGTAGIQISLDELRAARAKGNDNAVNCSRYDDNENFEAQTNLIMNLLRKFCIADRDAREVEESAGGQSEGKVDTFPLASVQVAVTRGLARAGRETAIAQANDRVVVRVFPSLNQDVTITIRNLDPSRLPATPGTVVPGFTFSIDADGGGSSLPTLPGEVRLSTVYSAADVAGLDKQKLVLVWLDPASDQWVDAPKQAADTKSNYISATITKMGTYAIYQR
jgi:hypothetical protein